MRGRLWAQANVAARTKPLGPLARLPPPFILPLAPRPEMVEQLPADLDHLIFFYRPREKSYAIIPNPINHSSTLPSPSEGEGGRRPDEGPRFVHSLKSDIEQRGESGADAVEGRMTSVWKPDFSETGRAGSLSIRRHVLKLQTVLLPIFKQLLIFLFRDGCIP
jgi:hypothetical protein